LTWPRRTFEACISGSSTCDRWRCSACSVSEDECGEVMRRSARVRPLLIAEAASGCEFAVPTQ
jgi:hypothetical protein